MECIEVGIGKDRIGEGCNRKRGFEVNESDYKELYQCILQGNDRKGSISIGGRRGC